MRNIFVTLLLLFSTLVSAGVFKWVDADGNVHYGDRPTKTSEQVNIETHQSNVPMGDEEARAEKRQRITESLTNDRLDRGKQRKEAKDKKDKLNRRCAAAKDRLKNYQRASRLYNLDGEGNRNTLSDKSRDKAIANLQKDIRKNCK